MTEAEFLPLFDQYHNMVYRLALSYTKSRQDAEDLVQTVFLKLLEGNHPPQCGKEKAWLAQVTVNASRDLLRSAQRRRSEPMEEEIPFTDETDQTLYTAVMALPPKYRVAMHLHYYEGYSLEETAKLLRVGVSAVSMRLHRARKLLRSALEEENDGTAISEDI